MKSLIVTEGETLFYVGYQTHVTLIYTNCRGSFAFVNDYFVLLLDLRRRLTEG